MAPYNRVQFMVPRACLVIFLLSSLDLLPSAVTRVVPLASWASPFPRLHSRFYGELN